MSIKELVTRKKVFDFFLQNRPWLFYRMKIFRIFICGLVLKIQKNSEMLEILLA